MRKKLESWVLVFCLFTFLLIVLGGGLRLNVGGALLAAGTGTPLFIYAFHCLVARTRQFSYQPEQDELAHNDREVHSSNCR